MLRELVDRFNRLFTRLHSRVYVGTKGWIGHRWTLVPSLILHTLGRRSGVERSVVLVYARDGSDYLVVGSNFGKDRPPFWLLNLEANSKVWMNVGHRRVQTTADIVAPDDPRYGRLFEIVNANNRRRYERYRELTLRPIPVVVLTPSA